jgi:hypothetical protein
MKVIDSATYTYRLDGNAVSDESLDIVLDAAFAMLARNDEIAPPFEEWDEEESVVGGQRSLDYVARTDTGGEIRVSFRSEDMSAVITLSSPEEEIYIGDRLLCTITSTERKYSVEEWL